MKQPYFNWTEDTNYGLAICAIQEGQKVYIGTADCSPADEDMKSEKVGCEIALMRANIHYYQGEKVKYRAQLEGLNHFKSTLSSNIDTNDYIYKRLLKEIKNLENKIIDCCKKIDMIKARLREYLKDKEDFYQYIRKRRQGKTD